MQSWCLRNVNSYINNLSTHVHSFLPTGVSRSCSQEWPSCGDAKKMDQDCRQRQGHKSSKLPTNEKPVISQSQTSVVGNFIIMWASERSAQSLPKPLRNHIHHLGAFIHGCELELVSVANSSAPLAPGMYGARIQRTHMNVYEISLSVRYSPFHFFASAGRNCGGFDPAALATSSGCAGLFNLTLFFANPIIFLPL